MAKLSVDRAAGDGPFYFSLTRRTCDGGAGGSGEDGGAEGQGRMAGDQGHSDAQEGQGHRDAQEGQGILSQHRLRGDLKSPCGPIYHPERQGDCYLNVGKAAGR